MREKTINSGTIFNIQRFSTQDGPGIRTTVFFKGCPLNCVWCHNPEGLSFDPELVFRKERCIKCGVCCATRADECPTEAKTVCGQILTVQQVMNVIVRDRLYYDQSGGGVTFSGGEPTAQPQFLRDLLIECRRECIATAIDTCGYAEKDVLIDLANNADLILYDLKGLDNERHISNTGVSVESILENLDTLIGIRRRIWLRLPVVPGCTDNPEEAESMASNYSKSKAIERVCLLPYHPLGATKQERLGLPQNIHHIAPTTTSNLDMLEEIWKRNGFDTHTGVRR